MPHIEVLPNSTSASAPGWAYVPDTGYDPSKAAIQPSGSRKRAAARTTTHGTPGENSARQNNAVLKHLADIDRDNHRDVQIAVPVKHRDAAGRVSKGKVTPAVRRILMSQKTFANHLADEEAALSNQPPPPTPVARTTATSKVARNPSSLAKRISTSDSAPTPATPSSAQPPSSAAAPPNQNLPQSAVAPSRNRFPPSTPDDFNPLLRSFIPSAPSAETIEALLSMPPLSYTAARAKPSSSNIPQRHFCEICGYWGRVRCMKCGARVCGLECKGVHDEGRCLKFYA
ncbi:MAG: hypothetical protein M1836_001303 [Candelina mexicana]|nr:MAG: hypothetical protein M1836_001303 [Candelina mexicana]